MKCKVLVEVEMELEIDGFVDENETINEIIKHNKLSIGTTQIGNVFGSPNGFFNLQTTGKQKLVKVTK